MKNPLYRYNFHFNNTGSPDINEFENELSRILEEIKELRSAGRLTHAEFECLKTEFVSYFDLDEPLWDEFEETLHELTSDEEFSDYVVNEIREFEEFFNLIGVSNKCKDNTLDLIEADDEVYRMEANISFIGNSNGATNHFEFNEEIDHLE